MVDLTKQRGEGRWCPRASENRNDYLQVEMESESSVDAVATHGTYSSYYSTSEKRWFSIGGTSLEFYKVDNSGKVRSQKLNEPDVMNASFGHP